jgi:hypothetical protein
MSMLQHQEVEESGSDLERIRKQLQSRSLSERSEAEVALNRLTPNELIDLMAIERQKRLVRKRNMVIGIVAYVAIMLTVSILFHTANMIMYIGSFSGVLSAAMAFSPAHKVAARALAKFDDVNAVGSLVETLEMPDPEVQSAVREGLAQLLPRLRASDAHLLNVEQRRILRKQMSSQPSIKNQQPTRMFIEAAVKGLEQVGDESFLETVENLANGRGFGVFDDVKAAADRCLPYLKQRIENDRLSHDLLRAASNGQSYDPDGLLRPAASITPTDPAELLRPTSE